MTTAEIKGIQLRIDTEPDGFWGPKSIVAAQRHLRRMMPYPNPWPKSDQASLTRFYGKPGDPTRLISMPAPVPVIYQGKRLKTILCHEKVADSLDKILRRLNASPFAHLLNSWDGCYNNRRMRGGSLPSLHARGAAADLDAANNGNKTAWPVVATMPFGVMEIFAEYGWIAAGAFWGRDGMHFQATQ